MTVIMQLLNTYAKTLLLYGLEAVNPNEREATAIPTPGIPTAGQWA